MHLRVTRGKKRVELSMRNTGAGIPPENTELVVERFYRIDPCREHAGQSFGLGRSIAKRTVEACKGDIRCESDGKTYVNFRVILRNAAKNPNKSNKA